MKRYGWLFKSLILPAVLVSCALMAQAGVSVAAAEEKIRLSFPGSPNLICGVGELSKIKTFPEEHRDYLRALFNDVYPHIVGFGGFTPGLEISISQ